MDCPIWLRDGMSHCSAASKSSLLQAAGCQGSVSLAPALCRAFEWPLGPLCMYRTEELYQGQMELMPLLLPAAARAGARALCSLLVDALVRCCRRRLAARKIKVVRA